MPLLDSLCDVRKVELYFIVLASSHLALVLLFSFLSSAVVVHPFDMLFIFVNLIDCQSISG